MYQRPNFQREIGNEEEEAWQVQGCHGDTAIRGKAATA